MIGPEKEDLEPTEFGRREGSIEINGIVCKL
jgi:hypothetical protein